MSAFTDQFAPISLPNLGLVRFPEVTIPPEDRAALGLTPKMTNRTVLGHLAWQGYLSLRAKGAFEGISEEQVREQFKTEFATFDKTGVHDYLLLVWDINRWADQQGIVRGWGRGSAASSLTLYCLGVTRVNPIRHHLNFPRFISEARMKPVIKDGVTYVDGKAAPDIDCDYPQSRRGEVIRYIETKYAGRSCKIGTRTELTGKTALKNALKVYADYKDEDAQRVSDLIEAKFGKVEELAEAKEKNEEIKKWIAASKANEDIYSVAMAIEGLILNKGQHASGVYIGYFPLDGSVPVEMAIEKRTGIPTVVTTYDMETIAGIGIKVDILGIRTLDLVDGAARVAGVSLDSLSVDDPAIYEFLNRPEAAYVGLFQIEAGTTKEAVVKVGPKDIDALSACVAISRPGALKYLDQYADYCRNGVFKPIYPAIDEVLKTTGNVLIYQEQITAICHHVFGLTQIDADQVRYAVGKKKKEEMAKWEPVLSTNGAARAIPPSVVKYFWEVCDASADYLFVLAHAVCYAYLCAICTLLKARYPQAYYLTMLRLAKEETDSTAYMDMVITEMTKVGIKLLPPDIIKSDMDFTIEGDSIRFGLASIKGISEMTLAKLPALRGKTFASKFDLFDAAKEAKIQINMMASLIYSGTLSWPGTPRIRLALEAQLFNLLSDNQKAKVKQFAREYNGDIIEVLKALPTRLTEKGKPIIPESQIERIRRDYKPYWDMYLANQRNENLTHYLLERQLLGFSYSSTLHAVFSDKVHGLLTLEEVRQRGETIAKQPPPAEGEKRPRQEPIKSIVFIGDPKVAASKANGSMYIRMQLTDDTGSFMGMLYGNERVESCKSFNGRLPEDGDICIVTGSLSKDGRLLFCDSVIVQHQPVCMKAADLKKREREV